MAKIFIKYYEKIDENKMGRFNNSMWIICSFFLLGQASC
jgi:hypothetical protein